MIEEPERDNRDFHEFMKELSAKQQEINRAELMEKVVAEEVRRHGFRQ